MTPFSFKSASIAFQIAGAAPGMVNAASPALGSSGGRTGTGPSFSASACAISFVCREAHTPEQLMQPRPEFNADISRLTETEMNVVETFLRRREAAVGVVERLQPIDVDHVQRHRRAGQPRVPDYGIQLRLERPQIVESRQVIGHRQAAQPPGVGHEPGGQHADAQEQQKVKRNPDAQANHVLVCSHVPSFPAAGAI